MRARSLAAGPVGLRDAVVLLTRVPLRGDPGPPASACAWFPVVGAVLGLTVAGVLLGTAQVLPVGIAALVAVAAEVLLTGALHLDGLADSADGSAGRDPEARLRIMRDHAVGVYGTTAVVVDLGLRTLALAALAALPAAEAAALVVVAWTLSRTALLAPALLLPYARREGTAGAVVRELGARHVAAAAGLAVALLAGAVLAGADAGATAAALLAAAVAAAGTTAWARRHLGGATGDVLGAAAELSGLFALLTLVALGAGQNG